MAVKFFKSTSFKSMQLQVAIATKQKSIWFLRRECFKYFPSFCLCFSIMVAIAANAKEQGGGGGGQTYMAEQDFQGTFQNVLS